MSSEEDLVANLASFQTQLQQVEAALLGDPENSELLKLQGDLKEVCEVTMDLLSMEQEKKKAKVTKSISGANPPPPPPSSTSVHNQQEYISAPATEHAPGPSSASSGAGWQAGDACQAVYSVDGMYYSAVIDAFVGTSMSYIPKHSVPPGLCCIVTFTDYGNSEQVTVASLRDQYGVVQGSKAVAGDGVGITGASNGAEGGKGVKGMRGGGLSAAEKEYRRARANKKKEKLKEKEQAQENAKNDWLKFSGGVKKKKGKVGAASSMLQRQMKKGSMFASPDTVDGRVGVVGSGAGMTSFQPKMKHSVLRKQNPLPPPN
eukprot:Nk52_evm13s249 gene=Nk52_evmTU13s249